MDHRRAIELLFQAEVFCPAVVPDLTDGGYIVFSAMRILGRGSTIDEAMKAARRVIPPTAGRPVFRGDLFNVILRDKGVVVCVAKSHTYADRIANALNLYNPNERGI